MKTIRWMCIQGKHGKQKQDWFCEWSLSYKRSDSIKLLIGNGKTTWTELKRKRGWRCAKVEVTFTEINQL